MNRIRSFLYRFPRFKADCRMDFVHGDVVFLGACTDLSESGLRGTFSEDVTIGSEGLLTLYHPKQQLQMRAKIESIRDGEVRVRFDFASDKDRTALSTFIDLFATRSRR